MKKFVVWVLAIIMLLSVCPMALAAGNSEVAPYGGTTSAYLTLFSCTMYSGKGSGYTVATLQKGTTVWSSDTSGTWYKVTYGTDTGYIEEAKLCEKTKCYTNIFLIRLMIYRRCCIMNMVMRNEKIHFHA